eukprot:15434649-Alexandrium_andersonii.AAC.1
MALVPTRRKGRRSPPLQAQRRASRPTPPAPQSSISTTPSRADQTVALSMVSRRPPAFQSASNC